MNRWCHLLLGLLLLAPAATAQPTDLGTAYPATLDFSEDAPPREWTTGPDDVWELTSFRYEHGDDLKIACGPSTVVFGVSGTNVVWAVLFPKRPGTLKSAAGAETLLWLRLRFHPARVGELFPAATVTGRGEPSALIHALRIEEGPLDDRLQRDELPRIPKREWLFVRTNTLVELRRSFFVNDEDGTVASRSMEFPILFSSPGIAEADAVAAFDGAYEAFDREYARFGLRPGVDFAARREIYRPLARNARTTYEAAGAIALLLRPLRDPLVEVRCGRIRFPGHIGLRRRNENGNATRRMLRNFDGSRPEFARAKASDGIGYVAIRKLADPSLPESLDAALEEFRDARGLIVDLRRGGGDGEDLAREMAERFTREHRVYAATRRRNGPGHDDLTEATPRILEPRGSWTWEKPVVVLIGRKTTGAAELFALMLAECPRVTTVGAPTAGAAGETRRLELPGGIVVTLPVRLDLDPAGNPIDEAGVQPDVPVDAAPSALREGDPVMRKALELLR